MNTLFFWICRMTLTCREWWWSFPHWLCIRPHFRGASSLQYPSSFRRRVWTFFRPEPINLNLTDERIKPSQWDLLQIDHDQQRDHQPSRNRLLKCTYDNHVTPLDNKPAPNALATSPGLVHPPSDITCPFNPWAASAHSRTADSWG